MKNILLIFGTRPEAIKMAPLIKEFKENNKFNVKVCVTAQHREMLDQVLDFFEIKPDYDLNLMKKNQSLFTLTSEILLNIESVLKDFNPDYIFVHGDTTTTMAASLAAFYAQKKVCHIEAGLRTFDKNSPFPEELNRQITSRITDYHFAPTYVSKQNLIKENIPEEHIIVTGNTVIDSLLYSQKKVDDYEDREIVELKSLLKEFQDSKIVLVTTHRRENHGERLEEICDALKVIAFNNPEVVVVVPVHMNPKVRETIYKKLSNIVNIKLIEPLGYPAFVWLMKHSYMIITDSGGIQEEAPSLGKPVLVMRDTTERPEAIEAGTIVLVGSNKDTISYQTEKLLNNNEYYRQISSSKNPYGDGTSSKKIVKFIAGLK